MENRNDPMYPENIGQEELLNSRVPPMKEGKTSSFGVFWQQYKLLLWKNWLIISRNKAIFFVAIISPFLIIGFLYFLQHQIDDLNDFNFVVNPPVTALEPITKCSRAWDCKTIAYGILGPNKTWIDNVIQQVSKDHNFEVGKDIILAYQGNNVSEFNNFFMKNYNKFDRALLFCTDEYPITEDIKVPCTNALYDVFFYTIFYNITEIMSMNSLTVPRAPLPLDRDSVALKLSVDNAIYKYIRAKKARQLNSSQNLEETPIPLWEETNPVNITLQEFPKVPNRVIFNYDAFTDTGGFFTYVIPMLLFMIILNELSTEKFEKLRLGLIIVGMSSSAYWLSWFTISFFLSLINGVLIVVAGDLFGFKFFLDTPFLVTCGLFTIFGTCLQIVAYMIVTFSGSMKKANTYSYAFFILGVILELFFCKYLFTKLIHDIDASAFTSIVRFIFHFYPAFHFSKIFGEIAEVSGSHFDWSSNSWIRGPGFTWDDMTIKREGEMWGIEYELPTTLMSFIYLILNNVFFGFLVWYFDRVLEENRGRASHALFFLTPRYWGCAKRKKKTVEERVTIEEGSIVSDGDININASISDSVQQGAAPTVTILDICKTYNKYPCGVHSKDDVTAVDGVSFGVDAGELLTLLGHNGAGKTTLMNILTGILSPSSGTIRFFGYDLEDDIDTIRKFLGVCPQFDVLWGDLSAYEHLYLFARVKNVEESSIDEVIMEKLRGVLLDQEAHSMVRTFSGGMKRRLSLAISSIGNPSVLLLDEPTTGMDPVSRAHVWKMIKEIKKDRCVLLTTHAMEEADILSDRIAVIVDGKLKCLGTALHLKNTFGEGYRLSIVTEPRDVNKMIKVIQELIPSSRIFDVSAGNLVFVIPFDKIGELTSFFIIMENEEPEEMKKSSEWLRSAIIDYGLSHTTLEEVFMKITHKKQSRTKTEDALKIN